MRIELECGVAPSRLACWLQQTDTGEVQVILQPLAGRALGQVKLPRTQVVFEGAQFQVEALYERFFLQFMGAGG